MTLMSKNLCRRFAMVLILDTWFDHLMRAVHFLDDISYRKVMGSSHVSPKSRPPCVAEKSPSWRVICCRMPVGQSMSKIKFSN